MRHLRTIGLAVLAALALTALVGTSSASAAKTVLCKTSGSYCGSGNEYASGTSLKASSSAVEIKGGLFGAIKCTESSLEGKTSAASGEPLPGEVSAWSLAGCTHFEEPCKAETAQHLPYSASFAYGTGGNGTLALKGTGGEAGWHINCPGVNCTFGFQPTLTFEGGNPAHLVANQSMKFEGGFCPTTGSFVATYTVSSPQPVYVAQPLPPGAVFCKTEENPCSASSVYPSGTKFSVEKAAGTEFEIGTGLGSVIKCSKSSFSGETTAVSGENGLPASIGSFSVSGCKWEPYEAACTSSAEGLPYSTMFKLAVPEELPNRMEVSKPTLHLVCGSLGIDCKLGAEGSSWTFEMTNGSPATVKIYAAISRTGTHCPSESTLSATYSFTSPKPLYLVKGQ